MGKAAFKQGDVERAVRGAVRGAGLLAGTFEIRISPDGSVRILPTTSAGVHDMDDPDAELKAYLADGDG